MLPSGFPREYKKRSNLPLTFEQQIFKPRYSSVQCLVRLYLPADFAQQNEDCTVIIHIKRFTDFFQAFP
jgi:hypothetical protein